ncbi:helicase-associated domain-containing protein, partial [Paenibacillus ihuae]|uniref:helicase-associated domain-containing protein n=1 Tax=Paenibacillus ihuae TaxID=1232431 RepID=UPI0006D559C1
MMTLSPPAQEVLRRICAGHAARPFAVEKLERLRPEALCRAELQLAMLELRQAGLVELRQKIWGEQLYQIPPQELAAIQWSCFPYTPKPLSAEAVTVEYPAEAGLAGQLFRALVFTAQQGLPLTAKGSIHKKQAGRLAALLPVQDKQLRGLFPPAAGCETCPLAVTVMVDLMLVLGLVERHESAYFPDMEKLESWLGLSEPQMTSVLYNVILNRYGIDGPAPQHFRYLVSSPAFAPGNWYPLGDVMEWMSQVQLTAEQPLEALQYACLAWLGSLAGFGWCELGYTEGGAWCFRWTEHKPLLVTGKMLDSDLKNLSSFFGEKDGHTISGNEAQFIVQPDFEVLVPPDVDYRLRWGLAGCSELLYADELWSFRLSRMKLEEAAEQGQPPEAVIGWLASHARGGLPSQVELSLRQWARSIGRTAWSEVILLACQSEADAADIAAHPRLQESLSQVGPLHFIV